MVGSDALRSAPSLLLDMALASFSSGVEKKRSLCRCLGRSWQRAQGVLILGQPDGPSDCERRSEGWSLEKQMWNLFYFTTE